MTLILSVHTSLNKFNLKSKQAYICLKLFLILFDNLPIFFFLYNFAIHCCDRNEISHFPSTNNLYHRSLFQHYI